MKRLSAVDIGPNSNRLVVAELLPSGGDRVWATVTAGGIRPDATASADSEGDVWAARSRSQMLVECFGREVVIQAVQ